MFTLTNTSPRPRPWKGEEPERTRQTLLLAGMECLPGQQDLFPGAEPKPLRPQPTPPGVAS